MSAPFQKVIIGGSSGEGSKGEDFFRKIYENYVKIVENETVTTFFLNCLDPSL
jgi:hypothetical protein